MPVCKKVDIFCMATTGTLVEVHVFKSSKSHYTAAISRSIFERSSSTIAALVLESI